VTCRMRRPNAELVMRVELDETNWNSGKGRPAASTKSVTGALKTRLKEMARSERPRNARIESARRPRYQPIPPFHILFRRD